MATVQVEATFGPARRAIAGGLKRFNRAAVGDGKAIAVSVREGAEIKGGAFCRFWHGWVYVDLLWIDEALRGRDLGAEVISAVEAHGRSLGARGVHLNTHGWQAKPFYEKVGYRVIGTLDDYPVGHACYFMAKEL